MSGGQYKVSKNHSVFWQTTQKSNDSERRTEPILWLAQSQSPFRLSWNTWKHEDQHHVHKGLGMLWPQTRVRWAVTDYESLQTHTQAQKTLLIRRVQGVVTLTYTETDTLQLQSGLTTDGVLQTSFHCSLFTCSRRQSSRYVQLHHSVWQKWGATVISQQPAFLKVSCKRQK